MSESTAAPDWLSWGRDAFERARGARKPVLLMVATRWSLGCAEMSRTTYRDENVLALIEKHFVPVWVDADERPDIADRYSLGGWPTTAFLAPDGRLLGGQRFTAPQPMTDLLARVATAFAARGEELMATPPVAAVGPTEGRPATTESLPIGIESSVVSHLEEAFDEQYGGFGRSAKLIQVDPLVLAADRYRVGDVAMAPILRGTLDAIGWGPIFDDAKGGVFRCCARRDWSEPSSEKLLDVNAAALRAFLEGAVALDEPRYRGRAADVIRYVRGSLSDAAGDAFFASEQATVDPAIYAAGNACMVSAFLRASEVLGDVSLMDCAIAVLERVAGETYRRADGVAHRVDDPTSVSGLLADQVALAEAFLDAYHATDREVYADLAQELMLFAMRRLWHERAAVFVDRAPAADDIGLLQQTITPFGANCRVAAVLARLARVSEGDEFADRARLVLRTLAPSVHAQSVDGAGYVLALRELSHEDPT